MAVILSPELDVRDLRVVLAIGATGTTAAAAEVLHITQSAVSRALATAESRAGTELFARTSRGLVPTDAGAVLLEQAPAILADLTALARRVRQPRERPRRVRFAAECIMAYPWLAQVVLRLRRTAPSIELVLPVQHADAAVEALGAGDLDVAMLTSRPPKGVTSRTLFTDELVFLVSDDHPLAAREHLRRDDLTEHTLLVSTARAGDRWFVRKVFGSRRVRLRTERFAVTEAIVEFARAGMGIAVLSEWIAAGYLGPHTGLRFLRLASGPLHRRWRLSHRPEVAPVIDALTDAIVTSRPAPRLGPS